MLERKPRTMRDMTILGGWLFADLLLALMVIFLAAQPAFPKPLPPTPTPIPTFSPTVSPSPTQEPRLDFHYQPIVATVDSTGILNNTSSAVNSMMQFINNQAVLHNRSAGLVIVYVGAPNDGNVGQAQNIGRAVISNVLKIMGRQGPLFQRASYFDPLFLLGGSLNTVTLDIYLFKK